MGTTSERSILFRYADRRKWGNCNFRFCYIRAKIYTEQIWSVVWNSRILYRYINYGNMDEWVEYFPSRVFVVTLYLNKNQRTISTYNHRSIPLWRVLPLWSRNIVHHAVHEMDQRNKCLEISFPFRIHVYIYLVCICCFPYVDVCVLVSVSELVCVSVWVTCMCEHVYICLYV